MASQMCSVVSILHRKGKVCFFTVILGVILKKILETIGLVYKFNVCAWIDAHYLTLPN